MKKHKPASPNYKGEQWKRRKKKVREKRDERNTEEWLNQFMKGMDAMCDRFGWR